MKKIYLLSTICVLSFFFITCSKDFLKSYDRRIVGTWIVRDIDRYGFGRSNNLPFKEDGVFTFSDNGQLTYTSGGNLYKGSWDIRKENGGDDDSNKNALYITVIDFVNQQVLTEYFNSMTFTNTNRFNAWIKGNSR